MKSGIYKITNPKNKVYIGKASDLIRRKNHYKHINCDGQPKIYFSLKKYGWENHTFEVIEECSVDELTEKEIYYKTEFINKNGWEKALFLYLMDDGGEPLSEETRLKISKAKKGHACFNDEWRSKIGHSIRNGNHAQYYTEEVKEKISKALKNKPRPFTQTHINNLTKSHQKRAKTVYQFDLQGNLIKEWVSKGEAADFLIKELTLTSNVASQIKDCILGRQKSAFGYIWSYNNVTPKNIFLPIHQFDLDKKLVNSFNSLKELKMWLRENRKEVYDINPMASTIKKKSQKRIYKSGNNFYSINKEI